MLDTHVVISHPVKWTDVLSVVIKTVSLLLSSSARGWSRAAADPEPLISHGEDVNQMFVNRNPRNLEQMAIAVKDRGWTTVWPKREYYHRCVYGGEFIFYVFLKALTKVMVPLISQQCIK